ncbi:MAG TPA: hypothetical protein VMX35_04815 [Acidobacteriota bacterium]|nr:hypothetical protein [Acidobacteriota bacterium]
MAGPQFRKLFKDDTQAKKPVGATGTPIEQGPFARRRLLIAAGLLFLGVVLFSLQALTASETALPHKLFYILWAAEAPQQPDETGEQQEQPDPVAQYKSVPSDDFSARFQAFLDGLEPPEGIRLLPVELLQLESRFVTQAGAAPGNPDDITGQAYYRVLKVRRDDSSWLFGLLGNGSEYAEGGYWLGPHPYGPGDGPREMILPSGEREGIAGILPEEASALSGHVVAVVDEIKPNAALIVSGGDMTVSEFGERAGLLGRAIGEEFDQIGEKHRLVPNIFSTDMLHPPHLFAAAVAGELFFLLGGFLLFYHLVAAVARKPEEEKRHVANMMRRAAGLVTANARLYSVVVGLVMFFWISGSAYAYIDPSGQRSLIQWFQSQFAGGTWPLGTAGWAYSSGNVILAAAITFAVNFLQGTVIVLTLPSLIPIATGFIFNALRTEILGLSLAPTTLIFGQSKVLHLPTILLELQAYTLAAFVSVLLPLALWRPQRFGLESRWEAYKKVAVFQFVILPLVAVILLVGAIYEAFELIVLVQLLR